MGPSDFPTMLHAGAVRGCGIDPPTWHFCVAVSTLKTSDLKRLKANPKLAVPQSLTYEYELEILEIGLKRLVLCYKMWPFSRNAGSTWKRRSGIFDTITCTWKPVSIVSRKIRFAPLLCLFSHRWPPRITGKYFDAFDNSAWIKYFDTGDGDLRYEHRSGYVYQ